MTVTNGRLYVPTDPGWYWYRDNGATWDGWGLIYDLYEPDNTDFAWINQGGASTVTTNGGVFLTTPGSSGDDVHMRVQDVNAIAPTTPPYYVIAAFLPLLDSVDQTSCGLVFRKDSTEEFIFFRLMFDSTAVSKNDLVFSVDKYDDPNTFNSSYATIGANPKGPLVCLKMADDGTNLTWSYSNDYFRFVDIYSASRTDFLSGGPDQIGFSVNGNVTSINASMTLLSWHKEEIG